MTSALPSGFAFRADDAVFLDFDGTLAPLQDDPDTVSIPAAVYDDLNALREGLGGALAIISGRDLSDLSKRVPQCLWRLGNHGLYQAAPNEAASVQRAEASADLVSSLEALCARHPATRLEIKGPVLALHYRAAPQCGDSLLAGLEKVLERYPDYRYQQGKCVLEAKPSAANKGQALLKIMGTAPFAGRRPVMFGDDTTDEDAFKAAQSLSGIAVKVGEGGTCAQYRIASVDVLHTLLKQGVL